MDLNNVLSALARVSSELLSTSVNVGERRLMCQVAVPYSSFEDGPPDFESTSI